MTSLQAENSTSQDMELLLQVSRLFTLQDVKTVLQNVVDLIAQAVEVTNISIILFENERVEWQYIINTLSEEPQHNTRIVNMMLEKGLAGWVMRNREVGLVEDTLEDGRWYRLTNYNPLVRSAMCIPLLYQDQLVAIITVANNNPGYFTERHQRLLMIIANQAAVAIHNLRLLNKVQSQQQQFETILQTIPNILLVLDAAGRIMILNQPACAMLGIEDITVCIGQTLDEIPGRDESLNSINAIIQETINTPLVAQEHLRFETRSERLKKDFNVTMSTWEDKANQRSGYMVVMHDVSTLKDLHRFKDEILRLASHDLRSPLALIVGFADMIALDTPDPESPVHSHVEYIHRSTNRMEGLLDELLRVERIRHSPLELHEQTDLLKLVRVVMVNARPNADQKHQNFILDLPTDDHLMLVVDPVLIRQVMENLVSNAIKYTPDGGKVTVCTYIQEGYFHFVVSDSGIGIPKESLPYIFEPFYRVSQPETKDIQGTGLGLTLVKEVIERHGGEVWVQSVPGQGSQFGFKLKLEK